MRISSTIDNVSTHKITVIPSVSDTDGLQYDAYGEVIKGGADTELVPCFIDLRKKRILDSNNRVIVYDAIITFGPTVEVAIDWKVKNGVDAWGNKLLKEGTVMSLDVIQHPVEGVVAKRASIVAQ
jgi:hypothetical protein